MYVHTYIIYIYIYIYIYNQYLAKNNSRSIVFYTKPTFPRYFLQILLRQFSGFHFLIAS